MSDAVNTNQPAKILFVSNSCWSIYNFRLDVIEHLINIGYEIHIAALKDDFAIKLVNIGCKVHGIYFNNRSLSPVRDVLLILKLKRLYKKIQPDLIFHYVIKPNIYGSIAASQLKIPFVAVITGLGYAFASNNWLSSLVLRLYKYALKKVNFVWLLNKDDHKLFIEKKIIDIQRASVLESEGINIEKFKPSIPKKKNGTFVFLMATRMLWSKGIGLFARASEILKCRGNNFECKVIGFFEPNHPDTISLEQLEEWKNKNIFSYLGFSDNVKPFFAEADCFVLPTYYQEGVPRSLLEACAMQLPVITTDNSGCREIVKDNVNGLICEMNSAEDLAKKMEEILHLNYTELISMGLQGRDLVTQKFDVKFTIHRYLKMINSIFIK